MSTAFCNHCLDLDSIHSGYNDIIMNLDINVGLLVLNWMLERNTWPQVIVVLLK